MQLLKSLPSCHDPGPSFKFDFPSFKLQPFITSVLIIAFLRRLKKLSFSFIKASKWPRTSIIQSIV